MTLTSLAAGVALIVSLGLGCASASQTQNKKLADARTHMVCRYEKPTGSNLSRRVCRTVQQMEDERRAVDEALGRPVVRGSGTAGP